MRRSLLLFDSANKPTAEFAGFLRDTQVPGDDLVSIDVSLQARFFQKNASGEPLERWELKSVELSCPPERFRKHLSALGFFDRTDPRLPVYKYAAWPGALLSRAGVRLADLVIAWMENVRWTEQIVVFGGKRPLNPDKENPQAALNISELTLCLNDGEQELSFADLNVNTELEMMKWLWRRTAMPKSLRDDYPIDFVDAPMKPPAKPGGVPVRPTTEDTILEWLKSGPEPGTILLSSGAPYGMAQDEAFWMLLGPYGFTVETFGHAAPDLPAENFMREVAGTVNRIRRARLG